MDMKKNTLHQFLSNIVLSFVFLCAILVGSVYSSTHTVYAEKNSGLVDFTSVGIFGTSKGEAKGYETFRLNVAPEESIKLVGDKDSNQGIFISLLQLVQKILLQFVLPVVAIGSGLYIAYMLFTAEGDPSKLKQAWLAVTYGIVAIIAIALSAFVVTLISRLSLG